MNFINFKVEIGKKFNNEFYDPHNLTKLYESLFLFKQQMFFI